MDPMDLSSKSGKKGHTKSWRNGIPNLTRIASHMMDINLQKTRIALTSDKKHGNRPWEFVADHLTWQQSTAKRQRDMRHMSLQSKPPSRTHLVRGSWTSRTSSVLH
ncbi:hypothetical protein GQ44DRAFT_718978, partial [Phaeosphaeriaceae sp. PMI808]